MVSKVVLAASGVAMAVAGAVLAVVVGPHLGPAVAPHVARALVALAIVSGAVMLIGMARANARNRRSP